MYSENYEHREDRPKPIWMERFRITSNRWSNFGDNYGNSYVRFLGVVYIFLIFNLISRNFENTSES